MSALVGTSIKSIACPPSPPNRRGNALPLVSGNQDGGTLRPARPLRTDPVDVSLTVEGNVVVDHQGDALPTSKPRLPTSVANQHISPDRLPQPRDGALARVLGHVSN